MTFDPLFYVASNYDLARAGYGSDLAGATRHWELYGEAEGRRYDSFDPVAYVASNRDLILAGYQQNLIGAVYHYVEHGVLEGRATTSFDPIEYLASNPDLIVANDGSNPAAALQHWLEHGAFEGRQTASFDPIAYLASNPDLIRAGLSVTRDAAMNHWLKIGSAEHRPTNSFDTTQYLAANPDLILAGYGNSTAGLLDHWLRHGAIEGRAMNGFDPANYLASNPDLILAGYGKNPAGLLDHWLEHGAFEGRATASFDPIEYLASNPDLIVGNDGSNPAAALQHWLEHGAFEGRQTASFNPIEYLASNPDLIRDGLPVTRDAAMNHWLKIGSAEHRPTNSFDPIEYLAMNPDLIRGGYGNSPAGLLDHWLQHGAAEGRSMQGFDALEYVASNVDLIQGGYALNPAGALDHWLRHGAFEGRSTTSFDAATYLALNPDVARLVNGDLTAGRQHWIDAGWFDGRHSSNAGSDAVAMVPGDRGATGAGDDSFSIGAPMGPLPNLVVGQGSSVGVAGSTPNPATDAPSAYFTNALNTLLTSIGLTTLAIDNRSVNGSTLYDGQNLYGSQIKTLGADIIFDVYGMNDGATAQYHSGETLPGAEAALRSRIAEAQAAGTTIVLTTSPHPHTDRVSFAMPDGIPVVWPNYFAPPVPESVLQQIEMSGRTMIDWKGVTIPAATRYLDVNAMIREVAADTGSLLIDAEAYWFDALRTHSQDELFDVNQFVHPNLLGYQLSYDAAINATLSSFTAEFWKSVLGEDGTLAPLFDALLTHGSIDGGAGRDTATFAAGYSIDLDRGYALQGNAAFTVQGIERVQVEVSDKKSSHVIGSAKADWLGVDPLHDDGSTGVRFEAGMGNDSLTGGRGADILLGGAGADTFHYTDVWQSTGMGHDRIDFDGGATDRITLPFAVAGISRSVSGTLSSASFDADLAEALGKTQLGDHQALLFTATSGTLAESTFLVIDTNGGGYQAGQDYVMELTNPLDNLTPSGFVIA